MDIRLYPRVGHAGRGCGATTTAGESSKGDDEDWDWTRRKSMGGDRFTAQRKAQARMLWMAQNNVQQCKVVCEVLFS